MLVKVAANGVCHSDAMPGAGMASAYAMYMGQLSDLRERLGEIRHGTGQWPGVYVEALTEESFLPVCSPASIGA